MGKAVWDSLWNDSRLSHWDEMSEEIYQMLARGSKGLSGKKILEAGAGSGRISARLAQDGASAYLIDYSDKAIEIENPALKSALPGYLLASTLRVPELSGQSGQEKPSTHHMPRTERATGTHTAWNQMEPPRVQMESPESYLLSKGHSTVLCLGSMDWNFLTQRPQHIARGLRDAGFRVIYVTSVGVNFQTGVNPNTLSQEAITNVILEHLPELVKKVEPNLFVIRPAFTIKDQAGNVRNVSGEFFRVFKRLFSDYLSGQYISWALLPMWYPMVANESSGMVVYDCVDEHSGFDPSPQNAFNEEKLLRRADIVTVTSKTLIESKRSFSDNFYYLPNGVHSHLFRGDFREPEDLKKIPHPRLGFVGALSRWVDIGLLRDVALKRPKWSIVLIGPHYVDVGSLKLPNVHFLGSKPYEELPLYYKHLDVGLIPFRTDDILAMNSNPIKALEYLAAGLPVVSTGIPEMNNLSHVVKIADRQGFTEAIQEVLQRAVQKEILGGETTHEEPDCSKAIRREIAKGESAQQQDVQQDDATQGVPEGSKNAIKDATVSKYEWQKIVSTACAIMASKVAASRGEYHKASEMLLASLPDAIDKARLHRDIRLFRRLDNYQAHLSAGKQEIEKERSHPSRFPYRGVLPLSIACRLPYCILMFPDWDDPNGPWVTAFRRLITRFLHNKRLTLALRADPMEVTVEKAMRTISTLTSEVAPEETALIKNMVLVNDAIGPDQMDSLLAAVDAVIVPETREDSCEGQAGSLIYTGEAHNFGSKRASVEDKSQDEAKCQAEYESNSGGNDTNARIIERCRILGVTVLRILEEGNRMSLLVVK